MKLFATMLCSAIMGVCGVIGVWLAVELVRDYSGPGEWGPTVYAQLVVDILLGYGVLAGVFVGAYLGLRKARSLS